MREAKRLVEICRIDLAHGQDSRLKNEPFILWGRMIPELHDGVWSYRTERFSEEREMCFPDEPYDLEKETGIFLGAYEDGTCIGLAVLRRHMFRYLYLDDLKVKRNRRGCGVGGRLIQACMEEARALGMIGVYTVGQDNNLSACLFYLNHGFSIGGFDNRAYRGTVQEDKADIYFYRDLE